MYGDIYDRVWLEEHDLESTSWERSHVNTSTLKRQLPSWLTGTHYGHDRYGLDHYLHDHDGDAFLRR